MKIGIIGLGLIGGSLFKDLKKNYDVIAISKSQNGKNIYKSYDVLKDRDLIFVCTPMNKTLSVLDELENILSPQTIVADVCSLKEFICKKERPYNFIPSHPMAGTEHKGYENSFEGLFRGAKWVITGEQNEKLLSVIKYLGAIPVFTTPEKHDEAPNMDIDLANLKRKVDLGADYVVTQMFFDNNKYFDFVERCRSIGITVPIIPGIKPIITKNQLTILPKVFHVDLPNDLANELSSCHNNDEAKQIGMEWCLNQARELLSKGVKSIHFYSLNATDIVRAVVKELF